MEAAGMDPKTIECRICNEYYKEPKILPCAHLMCRNCLVHLVTTVENAQCPFCLSSIVHRHNPDDIAGQLPTDEVMSEMVNNIKLLHLQHVCGLHSGMTAKSFCLHCRIMLCTACTGDHKLLPATVNHTLEGLDKLTLESLTSSRQPLCSGHPDSPEASKLYCVSHGVFLCHSCAISEHRGCEDIPSLKQMMEKYKQSLSEMEQRLSAVESALSKVMAEIETRFARLEQITKDSFTQIDAECDRLVLSIENCRKRLKKLVQDENDQIRAEAVKEKESLSHRRGLITSHRSLINRIQLSVSCTSVVPMVRRLNKRVSDLDLSVPSMSDCKPLTTAELTIDNKSLARIKSELERLGQLSISSIMLPEQIPWRFHNQHGENIVLTNKGMAAQLTGNFYGIVFSSEPMEVNMLYEVQVQETSTQYNGSYVGFGLVTQDPEAITRIPVDSTVLQSAITVYNDGMYVNQQRTPHNIGSVYNTIKAGSRVGVMIDAAKSLRIYVDKRDQGVVYRDVKRPCYAMFDLRILLRKVIVLPLTRVE